MGEYNPASISEPSQFLVDVLELLPKGSVLDVAMGGGRNAVYLAQNGFLVEGVDISAEAIAAAKGLAAKSGVSIKAEVADLERGYSIKKETYDSIICFYYLQRSLMEQIKAGIKQGGMVVYETYIVDQLRFGRPRNPEHLLMHNELLQIFRDFRCLRYREGIIKSVREPKAVASIVAQKI